MPWAFISSAHSAYSKYAEFFLLDGNQLKCDSLTLHPALLAITAINQIYHPFSDCFSPFLSFLFSTSSCSLHFLFISLVLKHESLLS